MNRRRIVKPRQLHKRSSDSFPRRTLHKLTDKAVPPFGWKPPDMKSLPVNGMLFPLTVAIAASGADCGSSSDKPVANVNATQFAVPDLNGTSDIARLGYPVVRDLTRELGSGAHLDLYFDIDSSISTLMIDATLPGPGLSFPCPDGGSVIVTTSDPDNLAATRSGTFTDCEVAGRTLSGSMVRDSSVESFAGGFGLTITVNFDQLDIDAGEQEQLLVSGLATRSRLDTSPVIGVDSGTCLRDKDNVQLNVNNAISSARWVRGGIAGRISISDSDYVRDDASNHDASSNETNCPVNRTISESGSAEVTFADYGASSLQGRATVGTEISINSLSGTETSSLTSALPDGSTVAVTAQPGESDSVQVDIKAAHYGHLFCRYL